MLSTSIILRFYSMASFVYTVLLLAGIVLLQNIVICSAAPCRCPGDKKCCYACKRLLCPNPVTECGNTTCKPDEVCVKKPGSCPLEKPCDPTLSSTCVPAGCATCKDNETCTETSSGYECTPTIIDLCGGCPTGQICFEVALACDRGVCFKFRCFPEP